MTKVAYFIFVILMIACVLVLGKVVIDYLAAGPAAILEQPTVTAAMLPMITSTASATAPGGIPLIVMMGQSNMSGRGTPMPAWSNPRAMIFDGKWQLASNPVARDDGAAHGPMPRFIDRYTTQYGEVGIIPCSQGGTTIADWQKGQPLFDDCAELVREAGGNVAAVLFYQGEADALNPEIYDWDLNPTAWRSLFEQMVADFRAEFGDAPVVFAQISGFPSLLDPGYLPEPWAEVQRQQAGVSMDCVAMISTSDLSGGDVHFHNAAYDEIGQRFFDALVCH